MQARLKEKRRKERAALRILEANGTADRVRAAYLGLRREDIQDEIKEQMKERHVFGPLSEQPSLIDVAVSALKSRGYDLTGVSVMIEVKQTDIGPTRLVFAADVSAEAFAAAQKAVGLKPNNPTRLQVN